MSNLDDMKKRIQYRGGARQQDRIIQDKLATLKKSLIYSYQGATAILDGGREFRCLINPSKIHIDEDVKVLSMPYKDICLNAGAAATQPQKTSDGEVETGISVGQIIEWKENGSHWLVYNQHLEERAYFRGELRRCDSEVELNGKRYWAYIRGPREKQIDWREKDKIYYNTMNYTALLYIPNNAETAEQFKRFTIIKIAGEPWEVQTVDKITNPGLSVVSIKEWYKNSIEEAVQEQPQEARTEPDVATQLPHIEGLSIVYPYEQYTYTIQGLSGGQWYLSNKRANIITQDEASAIVEITSGRSGEVSLLYKVNDEIVKLNLTIKSV